MGRPKGNIKYPHRISFTVTEEQFELYNDLDVNKSKYLRNKLFNDSDYKEKYEDILKENKKLVSELLKMKNL